MWIQTRGVLARLRKNVAGNTLAMAAAALLPLIAAVGGAVDISRYYMATSRLQAACDAGALAARKKMGDNLWEDSDRLHGLTFFDQNYPTGTFGLENLVRNYTADADGTVTGTATGALPTTLMQVFDFGQLNLSVTCSAEINISNTDIMFVIDVTGSMNCPADSSTCSNNGNVEDANAKIKGLRTAVMTFYDAVEDATSDSAQVRYGMVPYASNVNVGSSIPTQYMAKEATYQSREPQWETTTTETRISYVVNSVYNRSADVFDYYWWNPTGESGVTTQAQCDARVASSSLGFQDSYVDDSLDEDSLTLVSETVDGDLRTQVWTARADFTRAVPVRWYSSGYNPPCFVDLNYYNYSADFQYTVVDRIATTRTFVEWQYKPVLYDLTTLYDDNRITLPTGGSGADQVTTWDGCILEADTVATGTWDPLPSGAHDLNINLIPADNAQRWKPQLRNITYKREDGSTNVLGTLTQTGNENKPSYACPKQAFRLTDISRTDLQAYVDDIKPNSNTYHDIGMIWGARFISPRGIFAADNATAPNGDAIGRHIVFMTDGKLVTSTEGLTPYGMEWWDRKVTTDGNNSTKATRHSARFQAACKQARQENISVWIVAFGTTLTQNLIDCATPGRAYHASDSAALNTAFEEIAQRIAALRLTQ